MFLPKHERHGGEAAAVIVNESGALLLDDVWNGLDDLEEARWEKITEGKYHTKGACQPVG